MSAEEVTRLYELVQGTDVEAVRDVLKTTFDQETLNKALDIATKQLELNDCLEERFQICSELLSVGTQVTFDPKCKSGRDNYNLIQHCCYYGNSVLLKQALDSVDHFNHLSCMRLFLHDDFSTSHSPWSLTVRGTHTECIDVFFDDYSRNCVPFNTYPAIKYSAEAGNLACLNQLLKVCNNEYLSKIGKEQDAAILAFRNKHYECAKLLINCSSSIGVILCDTDKEEEWEFVLTNMTKNPSRKAAAQYIAARKNWECLKYVLQDRFVHAVDLNYFLRNYLLIMDCTILFNLIWANEIELIEQLLKYDVDMNSPCGERGSPLNFATGQYCEDKTPAHWKSVRTLISHGCDVDKCGFIWSRRDLKTDVDQCEFIWPRWDFESTLEALEMLLLAGANITPPPPGYWGADTDSLETEQEVNAIFMNTCTSYSTVAHPLKHLARLSVRRALTTSQFGTVPKLSGVLPPTLISYLKLPEIDYIEAKYGVLDLCADDGDDD